MTKKRLRASRVVTQNGRQVTVPRDLDVKWTYDTEGREASVDVREFARR